VRSVEEVQPRLHEQHRTVPRSLTAIQGGGSAKRDEGDHDADHRDHCSLTEEEPGANRARQFGLRRFQHGVDAVLEDLEPGVESVEPPINGVYHVSQPLVVAVSLQTPCGTRFVMVAARS
jgi:hypothetical protein